MATPSGGGQSKEGAPAFYRRRRRRNNEIGQLLLRRGVITPEQLRLALRVQSETGGHVGAILRRMGACDSRAINAALTEQLQHGRSPGPNPTMARRAREQKSISWLRVDCRPGLATLALLVTDLSMLLLSTGLLWLLYPPGQRAFLQGYALLAPVPLSMLALSAFRLYAVTPPSPPDEIRFTFYAQTFAFLACWVVDGLTRVTPFGNVPHYAWLLGWILSVLLVPIARGSVRSILARRPWWGKSVVVFGAGKVGRAVVTVLRSRPQLGLKPIAILDDNPTRQGSVRAIWGEEDIVIEPVRSPDDEEDGTPSQRLALEQFSEVEGVPVAGGLELAPALAQRLGIRTAVLAMPEMEASAMLALIERVADAYTNVLVIPDLFNLTYFGAPTSYLGGVLGIEVQRQLLLRGPRTAKRLMDVVLTSLGMLAVLPILMLIGLVIRLDSKGPVFHRQKRLGQDGVRFQAFKFRTMYADAEQRLQELLASDPVMREEYREFHKLSVDPRITRVGRFLRKYSLDELPQLWNVLVGEMSLVGPRPYLEREIPDMAQKEAIILRVKPGITGIWQVTWRNESTFDERVNIDVEYVRNWTPWMDLYILARTVPVVLGGTGW